MPAKTDSAPKNRMTISGMLKQISHEALVDFVTIYADRDKDFALQLRTYFAVNMPLADADGALKDYLNRLIKDSVPTPKSKKYWEPYVGTIRQLLTQARRASREGDLGTPIRLLGAILATLPIVKRELEKATPLRDIVHDCINLSVELMLKPQANETRLELLESWWHGRWVAISILGQLDECLANIPIPVAQQLGEQQQLLKMGIEQLNATGGHQCRSEVIWIAALAKSMDTAREIALQVADPIPNLLEAITLSNRYSHFHEAIQLTELTLDIGKDRLDKEEKKELIMSIVHWGAASRQPEVVIQSTRTLVVEYHVAEMYPYFAEITPPEQQTAILLELETSDQLSAHRCRANILVWEADQEGLINFLTRCNNSELKHEYLKYLLPEYEAEMQSFYQDWITKQLDGYFGPIPATKIIQVLTAIRVLSPTMTAKLIDMLYNEYPDRIALQNLLKEF